MYDKLGMARETSTVVTRPEARLVHPQLQAAQTLKDGRYLRESSFAFHPLEAQDMGQKVRYGEAVGGIWLGKVKARKE